MTWVYLDDKFHSNPKVLDMGNAGAGLYARALSYCGDHLTDGFVPGPWAKAAGSKPLRDKLVTCDAWSVVPGGYHIPDYLKLNPSKEQVLAKRAKRSAAGAKGAEARWHNDGNGDGNSHEGSDAFATSACMHPSPSPPHPLGLFLAPSPTRDDAGHGKKPPIDRLVAACGGGPDAVRKIGRTIRRWKSPVGDLEYAIECATGPGVRDALGVALSELKKRGEERNAA